MLSETIVSEIKNRIENEWLFKIKYKFELINK